MKIGAVVIDSTDFPAMVRFWQAALRYVPRDDEPEEGWMVLIDPNGEGLPVFLMQVEEPRAGRNRLHLDLYTSEPGPEIERLLALGARLHPRTPQPDDDFTVLEDPDGHLFCVVDQRLQPPQTR